MIRPRQHDTRPPILETRRKEMSTGVKRVYRARNTGDSSNSLTRAGGSKRLHAVVYLQTCVRNIVLYPTNLSLPRTRIKTFLGVRYRHKEGHDLTAQARPKITAAEIDGHPQPKHGNRRYPTPVLPPRSPTNIRMSVAYTSQGEHLRYSSLVPPAATIDSVSRDG